MGDKATRKMDADEFRALVEREGGRVRGSRAETVPASDELMDALVAQTRPDPDDDLAIPVEEAPPKPRAVIVPEHRQEMRHAGGIAPITKPPPLRAELPPAPRSRTDLVVNVIITLVLAAIVVWLFT